MNAYVYNRVTPEIVEALRHIVGEGNVLTSAEEMEPYTHDEAVGLRADPEVVVKATSARQIDERWEEIIPPLVEEIHRLTLFLGAMITREHGIGAIRRKYLPLAWDEGQIEIMEKIREVFDPNGILNPAKIFP